MTELVPKNFMLRCHKCRWARRSTGLKDDLADMSEIKNCVNCGKVRKFRCKCGGTIHLRRICGNKESNNKGD